MITMYLREAVLESFIKMKFDMDSGEGSTMFGSLSTIKGEALGKLKDSLGIAMAYQSHGQIWFNDTFTL